MYPVVFKSNCLYRQPAPFRIFSQAVFFLSLFAICTTIREHVFPIPLRALFITGRRVKIAPHDVNESVVW